MPTILSIAYPFAAAGRDAIGGAEQILTILDEAVAAAGWDSLVIARAGSQVQGTLIELPAFAQLQSPAAYCEIRRIVAGTLLERSIHIVHAHGCDFDRYIPAVDIPVIATIHLPPEWYSPAAWNGRGRELKYIAVSHSQARRFADPALVSRVIENGIDLDKFEMSQQRGNFVLALGRICPEKGFHLAIEAASRAGYELLLGGQVFPYETHLTYFHREIAPRLDDKRRYAGPLAYEEKRQLLATARALLIPSLAPETSSLVAMEALASGTPVIAFAAGALPEIVAHGKTGFVVENVTQMAEAIAIVDTIDRDYCRAEAARRFSSQRMSSEYLSLYREILSVQEQ
jgi:glycosyltransferase involved in cell wall biosynthesis